MQVFLILNPEKVELTESSVLRARSLTENLNAKDRKRHLNIREFKQFLLLYVYKNHFLSNLIKF